MLYDNSFCKVRIRGLRSDEVAPEEGVVFVRCWSATSCTKDAVLCTAIHALIIFSLHWAHVQHTLKPTTLPQPRNWLSSRVPASPGCAILDSPSRGISGEIVRGWASLQIRVDSQLQVSRRGGICELGAVGRLAGHYRCRSRSVRRQVDAK